MIKIQLKLFVTLSKYLPAHAEDLPLEEGTSVGALMASLDIPRDEVKLIFVNGRKADPGHVLAQGDRLGLFPPVGGG